MINYTNAQYNTALARAKAQGIRILVKKGHDAAQGIYFATSSDGATRYMVNARAGICNCEAGRKEMLCKHVAAGIAAYEAHRCPVILDRTPSGPDLAAKRALRRPF